MKVNRFFISAFLLLALLGAPGTVWAAGGETPHPVDEKWSFDGPFGTYDRAALQRGFLVYKQVCSACHGMKHLAYRNLTALGYSEDQVKNIAAEYSVTDGPDDEGEMFERTAKPSDKFKSPFPNDQAAKYANGGALPPDLSLITKARHSGSDYVYSLLTGYEEPEHAEDVPEGKYWNKYFPGHVISMAPPLADDMIVYEDGTPQTVGQYSADVAHFLTWAADPYMEDRKRTGIKVILFLAVFAMVMYAVKRRLWAKLH